MPDHIVQLARAPPGLAQSRVRHQRDNLAVALAALAFTLALFVIRLAAHSQSGCGCAEATGIKRVVCAFWHRCGPPDSYNEIRHPPHHLGSRFAMYLARFSNDVLPANRERAIDFVRQEVEAAKGNGLNARLLVPLTRRGGGAALQFEVELSNLDQLDDLRINALAPAKRLGVGCTRSARSLSPRPMSRSCDWMARRSDREAMRLASDGPHQMRSS